MVLVVLAQAFTVVGDRDDHGPIEPGPILKRFHEPADLQVDECDFTVVGMSAEAHLERRRGRIWCVRIVEMNPAEKRTVACEPGEPPEGRLHNLVSPPSGLLEIGKTETLEP